MNDLQENDVLRFGRHHLNLTKENMGQIKHCHITPANDPNYRGRQEATGGGYRPDEYRGRNYGHGKYEDGYYDFKCSKELKEKIVSFLETYRSGTEYCMREPILINSFSNESLNQYFPKIFNILKIFP